MCTYIYTCICISCTIRAFLMHSGCSRRVPMAVNLPVRRSTLLLLLSLHNCICCSYCYCCCCCCCCLEHLWSALAKGSESAAVVGALCLCCLATCNIYTCVPFSLFFFFCILCPSATFSSSAAPSGPVGGGLWWVGLSSTGHQRHRRSAQVLCFCLLSISICFFMLLFLPFPSLACF